MNVFCVLVFVIYKKTGEGVSTHPDAWHSKQQPCLTLGKSLYTCTLKLFKSLVEMKTVGERKKKERG